MSDIKSTCALVLAVCLCVFGIIIGIDMIANMGARVLVSTDTVEIVQEGRETRITDRQTGARYALYRMRVRRGDALETPYTALDTPTLRIEIVSGGYRVEAGGEVYESLSKWGGLLLWAN